MTHSNSFKLQNIWVRNKNYHLNPLCEVDLDIIFSCFVVSEEAAILSLKIWFRCGIFSSYLDQPFSSGCLQNICYKDNDWWRLFYFFPNSAWLWRIKWWLCALLLLKCSSRIGSAPREGSSNIWRVFKVDGKPPVLLWTFDERTSMQLALL